MLPEAGSGNRDPEGPPPRRAAGGPRAFSVAEANALLPYLRGVLSKARVHLAAMRAAHRELRAIEAVGRDARGAWILAADHRATVATLRQRHAACAALLQDANARGCLVKDLDVGVCDFPGQIADRPVLLCWRLDEQAVTHFHGLDDGFAGRRAIPPETP